MAGYELGIIGGGRMGEAIIRSLIDAVVCSRQAMVISDPDSRRRMSMANDLRLICVPDNKIPAACRQVLLAVESRVMPAVLEEIAPVVSEDTLIISIAPDISTQFIDDALGGLGRIVRVAPNAPVLTGAGMSAICAGPRAEESDLKRARKIFAACGKTAVVDEKFIGAAEAISSCGPAYLFYLAEAMIQAGTDEGLDPEIAKLLTEQTFIGAAKMLAESTERPEILRMRTTSPGSAAQRAAATLDAGGVSAAFVSAVRSAAEKSRELEK